MLIDLRKDLQQLSNPKRAEGSLRFFKTGKGQYGEGDIFIGLTVPQSREIAIKYKDLSFDEVENLLKSKIHEERLIALLILVRNFSKGNEGIKKAIYDFYLSNSKYINNWDLVDLSAGWIVGNYLLDKPRDILLKLAKSSNLWEKRISIIATFAFIRNKKESEWTFNIADILLNDKHDLIQKAVGWMLREVGKNISQEVEEEFLKARYKKMPRTMLRYAIERFDEKLRKRYLTSGV